MRAAGLRIFVPMRQSRQKMSQPLSPHRIKPEFCPVLPRRQAVGTQGKAGLMRCGGFSPRGDRAGWWWGLADGFEVRRLSLLQYVIQIPMEIPAATETFSMGKRNTQAIHKLRRYRFFQIIFYPIQDNRPPLIYHCTCYSFKGPGAVFAS